MIRHRMRLSARGKGFLLGDSPFLFRAAEYRPPRPTPTAGRVPVAGIVRDLERLRAAGFTVVNVPSLPRQAIEPACETGLRFLLEPDEAGWAGLAARPRRGARRAMAKDLGRAL